MAAKTKRGSPTCSFCGKRRSEVSRLVAGPGVYICDRCIELCNEILSVDADSGPPRAPSRESRLRQGRLARLRDGLADRVRRWRRLRTSLRFAFMRTPSSSRGG